jgi:YD repeat-containing protein
MRWRKFTYDALNRATSAVYPAGKGQSIYWGYDLLNRGLYANYGSATGPGVSYAYDALGRVTSETSVGKTMAYQYDAAGNRTRMTWPDTGANALYVAYVYDVLNRVTMVEENGATSGPGLLASYGYDSLGRRSTLARAGGAGPATGYTYDGRGSHPG